MTHRSKWLVLTLLLIVWGVLLVQRFVNVPEPQRVTLKFTSGQTLSREAARGTGGLPVLIDSRTASAQQIAFKKPKNIFAPLSLPEKKLKKKRTRIAKEPKPSSAPPEPTAPPLPTPEELARVQRELAAKQARQQMGQYRFLGYLTRGGEQQAFLGKGRKIYIVRAGETLDGFIQIQAVDASSVKLKHQPTNLETTLLLKKEGNGIF